MNLEKLYKILYKTYGPQGWWPLLSYKGINPTKTGSINGYHPNNFSFPRKDLEKFEICLGAILTQNTSWLNVEKALLNLKKKKLINPKKLIKKNIEIIIESIRPAGFYNQKSKCILEFSKFFLKFLDPKREELLNIKGIGPETADSILLYAYKKPSFVVDSYTKRILIKIGNISEDFKYNEIKELFESNLPKDYKLYQEFHALLVEHAKRFYSKKPYGANDTILQEVLPLQLLPKEA